MKTYKTTNSARVDNCKSADEMVLLLRHAGRQLETEAAATDRRESENCPRAKYLRKKARRFFMAADDLSA
jgi:hypothetical protein